MEEVSMDELIGVIYSFQIDKIPSLDWWTIEYFLETFSIMGGDLLWEVEENLKIGRIMSSFNSTLISLKHKVENPITFDDFGTISLCNGIYKIVGKIIA